MNDIEASFQRTEVSESLKVLQSAKTGGSRFVINRARHEMNSVDLCRWMIGVSFVFLCDFFAFENKAAFRFLLRSVVSRLLIKGT